VQDAVLTNCGTIATFRTGALDAALLDGKFPAITTGQMQRLAQHQMAVTFGDRDVLCQTDPPLVDIDDDDLDYLHRASLGLTASSVAADNATKLGAATRPDPAPERPHSSGSATSHSHCVSDRRAGAVQDFSRVLDALLKSRAV
jgi:hypothetical protein